MLNKLIKFSLQNRLFVIAFAALLLVYGVFTIISLPVDVLPESKQTLPNKDEVYFSIEGLIHHFEQIMTNRGHQPPIGEAYGANETANGELGFYLASDGGNTPYRARCRPPSFVNYQCFPDLVVGHQISDVIAVLSGMNIIAAELDR